MAVHKQRTSGHMVWPNHKSMENKKKDVSVFGIRSKKNSKTKQSEEHANLLIFLDDTS